MELILRSCGTCGNCRRTLSSYDCKLSGRSIAITKSRYPKICSSSYSGWKPINSPLIPVLKVVIVFILFILLYVTLTRK